MLPTKKPEGFFEGGLRPGPTEVDQGRRRRLVDGFANIHSLAISNGGPRPTGHTKMSAAKRAVRPLA